MAVSLFAAFWGVSILFVITPGADWAYAISAGIRGRVVLPAIAGLLSGHLLATLIVATGVGALVTNVPIIMTVLTLAGAGYLFWLGIGMIKHPSVPTSSETKEVGTGSNWAWKGLFISGLNPKVFLLFLALLPQFTDPESNWSLSLQMIALGMVHVFNCAVVYLIVAWGSRRVLQTRPKAAQRVSQISGALMILIAAFLITESFM